MLNCMNIGILLVYAFILFKVLKKEQKMEMFILTGVAFFLLNNTEGFTDADVASDLVQDGSAQNGSDSAAQELVNPGNINSNNVNDDGGKVEPNPLVSAMNMGPYDGICLKTGNKEYWMKSPDNTSLVPNDTLYSYLGSQGPVKMRLSDQSALIGPPVDGVKGSDEKMFMFANNKTSLACCPSTFSTSTGCVCTTENQRDFIAGRGVLPAYEGSNESNAEF
jgi:hypothetical protein